jgi:hypothetical protein
MNYLPNRGDAYRMMPGPAGQPALRGMVPDLPDIGWREPPSAAVFGGISLVHEAAAISASAAYPSPAPIAAAITASFGVHVDEDVFRDRFRRWPARRAGIAVSGAKRPRSVTEVRAQPDGRGLRPDRCRRGCMRASGCGIGGRIARDPARPGRVQGDARQDRSERRAGALSSPLPHSTEDSSIKQCRCFGT